jgi:hypothetical protein
MLLGSDDRSKTFEKSFGEAFFKGISTVLKLKKTNLIIKWIWKNGFIAYCTTDQKKDNRV